jgi:hypothetical protein
MAENETSVEVGNHSVSRRGLLASAGAFTTAAALGREAGADEYKRGDERSFEGESDDGKVQNALDNALGKVSAALPEGGVADASATWRLLALTGELGGIRGVRVVRVTIAAIRTPPWPKK